MLAKTITYTDFEGVERTETHYFHFSDSEIMKMEMGTTGGLGNKLRKIIEAQDAPEIMKNFEDIVLKAYGIKNPDNRTFEKSETISRAFSQTGAYDKLFMELVTDPKAAAAFVNAVLPNKEQTPAFPAPAAN